MSTNDASGDAPGYSDVSPFVQLFEGGISPGGRLDVVAEHGPCEREAAAVRHLLADAGAEPDDVLGGDRTRVIDALLRKHYTACTADELATVVDRSPERVEAAVKALQEVGVLAHGEDGYHVDKDDRLVYALRGLQIGLLTYDGED